MKVNFEYYDDGDIDVLLVPENYIEKTLCVALQSRNPDNLGVDDGQILTIRLQEPAQ